MRMRFWNLVHRQLERAWHWVYYSKVAPDVILVYPTTTAYAYSHTMQFIDSRGNIASPVRSDGDVWYQA